MEFTNIQFSKNSINYVFFALLAIFWSGSFIAIKVAVTTFPPIFSAMLRLIVSVSFLTLYLIFTQNLSKDFFRMPWRLYWRLWVIGLFAQAFPFILLFWGEKFIAPALAGILNGTMPLWLVFMNTLIFRDRTYFTFRKISGFLLGFSGIVVIFYPLLHLGHANNSLKGVLAVTGMAICYALSAILYQRIIKKENINFYTSVFQQNLGSMIFLILASFCFEPWPSFGFMFHAQSALLGVLYLGLCSTGIAWLMYYHLIREWDAARASTATYFIPVLAILWDYLLINAPLHANQLFGAGQILLGVLLIQM